MILVARVRYHLEEAARLYRLARSWPERISIGRFILKLNAARIGRVFAPRFLSSGSPLEDTTINLGGAKHVIGLWEGEIYPLEEIYRHHVYDEVPAFIPRRGWTVFDIGANVGAYAIQQALRGAYVYALEPNPHCFRRLSRAVVDNRVTSRVSVLAYAAGRTPGVGLMDVPNGQTPVGTVKPVTNCVTATTSFVRITSLDCLVPSLGVTRVDLLKIDTEGAEVEVLQGAAQVLSMVERIIVEYHAQNLQQQVTSILAANGFSEVLQLDNPYVAGSGVLYAEKAIAG